MLRKTITALALAASLGVTLSLAGASASITGTGGWTNTNANAADSRANLAESVLTPAAVSKVKYLRSVVSPLLKANAFCTSYVAAPLLAGGNLYASTNEYLSKYDPATGRLLWRVNPNLNGSFFQGHQSLATSAGLIVLGAEGCGSVSAPGGFVEAFNASTGALAWTGRAPEGMNQAVVVGTSYVVAEGADAEGSNVDVLNLKDGTLIWRVQGCQTFSRPNDPVVVGLIVMGYGCDKQFGTTIEARHIATGALAWSLPPAWEIQRGDLAGSTGTHIYATDPSGTVEALNPQTGQVEYPLNSAKTVLAVDATRVYATCGGSGGNTNICAYGTSTGGLEWQKSLVTDNTVQIAAEADGVLYLDSGHALNASTGQVIKRIWFNDFGSPTAMAVGDGRIAVVSDPRVLDLFGLPGS